jgi:hypothetical protein
MSAIYNVKTQATEKRKLYPKASSFFESTSIAMQTQRTKQSFELKSVSICTRGRSEGIKRAGMPVTQGK